MNIASSSINIILFLTSAQVQENIFWFRTAFFITAAFFLGAIIFLLIRTKWLRYFFIEDLVGFLTYKPYGMGKMMKQWRRISKRLDSGSEDEYKTAILEGEELLEETLKKMDYPGENLKERLDKLSPTTVSNLSQIHQAHQIRNEIVYNPEYRLSLDQAKKTLDIYEQALKDLQLF